MSESTVPVRVWDLPTRVFHWVLALSVVASIITA
jgi:cytochrome b